MKDVVPTRPYASNKKHHDYGRNEGNDNASWAAGTVWLDQRPRKRSRLRGRRRPSATPAVRSTERVPTRCAVWVRVLTGDEIHAAGATETAPRGRPAFPTESRARRLAGRREVVFHGKRRAIRRGRSRS